MALLQMNPCFMCSGSYFLLPGLSFVFLFEGEGMSLHLTCNICLI